MSAQPKLKHSLEEYLEIDRNSNERLEFWNGKIFSMSSVSRKHATFEMNVSITLGGRLRAKGCQLFPANVRIKVPGMPPYRYSDLSALCDKAQFEKIGGVDALVNPSLIIEILSPSTEAYDRGNQFTHYKSIPHFQRILVDRSTSSAPQPIHQTARQHLGLSGIQQPWRYRQAGNAELRYDFG